MSNTIQVGEKVVDEYDAIRHEYVHSIQNDRRMWEHPVGLYEGLADYLPCSFKSSPNFGERTAEILSKTEPGSFTKPYYWTMDNRRRFDELGDHPESPDQREVWGGAFWELRQGLGKDAQGNYLADVLLLRTVMSLTPPGAGTEARADFVRQLLEQEHRVTGGRFASRIRDVFRSRGLKL